MKEEQPSYIFTFSLYIKALVLEENFRDLLKYAQYETWFEELLIENV